LPRIVVVELASQLDSRPALLAPSPIASQFNRHDGPLSLGVVVNASKTL